MLNISPHSMSHFTSLSRVRSDLTPRIARQKQGKIIDQPMTEEKDEASALGLTYCLRANASGRSLTGVVKKLAAPGSLEGE